MENAPVILAIDTSLGPCSVAVWRAGAVAAQSEETHPGQQSRVLIPLIESTLAQCGARYGQCDAVACTIGPGGFTGIRTGLAAARAIALATGIPLIGLSTLETLAWSSPDTGDVLSVIDAYRGQYYLQRFRKGSSLEAQSPAMLVEEKALNPLGHGAKRVLAPLHARHVASLAAHKWGKGERNFPDAPLYIREPDAKLPLREGLKCAKDPL